MLLTEKVKSAQIALANYCRTGKPEHVEGVDPIHVKHYRRLVYNIIADSLQSAYPLTHQMLDQQTWDRLIDEFFSEHHCQSPQVWTMPKELYEYMRAKSHPLFDRYECLPNLMWMEWLEVELYMMEDLHVPHHNKGLSGNGKMVINPEHRLLKLSFPVHMKNAGTINFADKSDYFLSMHRDPSTGKVIFNDLSVFFFRMMEILAKNPMKSGELIEETAADFGIPSDQMVHAHSLTFLKKAIQNQLILGFTS